MHNPDPCRKRCTNFGFRDSVARAEAAIATTMTSASVLSVTEIRPSAMN